MDYHEEPLGERSATGRDAGNHDQEPRVTRPFGAVRSIHKAATALVLTAGIVHAVGTFFFFERLTDTAVWFAGAGLCAIFVALLNVGLWARPVTPMARRSAAAANFLFFFWIVAGVWAVPGVMPLVVGVVGAAMVITAPHVMKQASRATGRTT